MLCVHPSTNNNPGHFTLRDNQNTGPGHLTASAAEYEYAIVRYWKVKTGSIASPEQTTRWHSTMWARSAGPSRANAYAIAQ